MFKNGRLWPNTLLRLTIDFTDDAGDYVDPSTVTFKLRNPCGTITTYVYGTDAEIQKAATGQYTMDVTPDRAGRWFYRWITTGTGTTLVKEDSFIVQTSPFVDDCYSLPDYA